MNRHLENGFIFLAMLIFLQLFTSLSVYGLMRISGTLQRDQHLWQRESNVISGQRILRNIEKNIASGSVACIIPITPAEQLIKKSELWWYLHACSHSVGEIHYYYAVELLGEDTCGFVMNHTNQTIIADYNRITLYLLSDKLGGGKLILQSTITIPLKQTTPCHGKIHGVGLGRQMWREL